MARRLERLPFSHFTHDGNPKFAYDEQAAQRIAQRDGQVAYPCGACGAWHVGGPTRRRPTS